MVLKGLKNDLSYLILLIMSLQVEKSYKISVLEEIIKSIKNIDELDKII